MATEGFTGLDIAAAKRALEVFYNSSESVSNQITKACADFFDELHEKWASENASEFTTPLTSRFMNLIADYNTAYWHIVTGAEKAAQSLASANGTTFHCVYEHAKPGERWETNRGFMYCYSELNGVTGMDVEGVRNALDIFKVRMTKALGDLESVPNGISFYDPAGNLVGSYNRNLSEFKGKFSDLFTEVINGVTKYMETETDNILLAKQKATDILNG